MIQETKIDVKRIIKEFVGISTTSCFMECESDSECYNIGTKEEPSTQEKIHCYLLKKRSNLATNDKEDKKLFIIEDVSTILVLFNIFKSHICFPCEYLKSFRANKLGNIR